jgi:hypothetical protein
MQLIALHSSPRFSALKWAAAGVTLSTGLWLALACAPATALWAVPAALVPGLFALRVRAPQGLLRLRPEGFCEWIETVRGGSAPALEMTVAGLFGGAGWLVLRLAERHPAGRRGFGGPGRALVLVLPPDAAVPEEMRQLQVWLRLAAPRAELNSRGAQWS